MGLISQPLHHTYTNKLNNHSYTNSIQQGRGRGPRRAEFIIFIFFYFEEAKVGEIKCEIRDKDLHPSSATIAIIIVYYAKWQQVKYET